MAITTELGKHILRQLGEDAKYFEQQQCRLERMIHGGWALVPHAGTKNETLLNGRAVTERVTLKSGDVLAVGREAKGVCKPPLTIRLTE
jgi:hypothetical protein